MSITLHNGVHVRLRVISALPGERSIPGPAPTLLAGDVIALAPGTPATAAVTLTANPGEYEIAFGIPQGPKGDSFDIDATVR